MERKEFLLSGLMAGLAIAGIPTAFARAGNGDPMKTFYLPPDESPLDPGPAMQIRMKVRSKQTNLQYSCVDVAVAPKTMGPAPHVHDKLDELMYVHEGTMHVLVGKEVFEVKAGGWHFRPRGVIHTFWNATDSITRCTDMYFNQNFDDFLEELFFRILPDMHSRNVTPADPKTAAAMDRLHKQYGITSFPEQRQAIVSRYGLK